MRETRLSLCTICDASCALAIEVDGRRVVSIRGNAESPWSHGHICPKATALKDVFDDPDRLRRPMRRVGTRWEPLSWEQALPYVAERLARAQRDHGRDALGIYFGNPIGHSHQALLALIPLLKLAGSKNQFSSGSVDAHPRMLVSRLLYGNQALLPVPDVHRSDFLVVMGANPAVSNGSVMTTPDVKRCLGELIGRGGKLVVIDPRRTETAKLATEHVFIRPGTDALFLLATLQVIFAEELASADATHIGNGVETLKRLAAKYPPERVSDRTGVSAEVIRALAREFARAPRAAWYGRMGTCTQEFGCVTTWLIDALNLITGHLDRPGGMMFATPAADLAALASAIGERGRFDRWRSRVGGLPELNGELPVAALADEIETPGAGQVRALLTIAGNPVLSVPNGRRIDRALGHLDFMASVDFYLNETTRHADVILPPATPLESDQYPLLELAMATRNAALFAPAVFERSADSRSDAEILTELGAELARARGPLGAPLAFAVRRFGRAVERGHVLDLLLRLGPHKTSLARLRRSPHGIDFGPLEPRLARVIQTRDRRVDLAPSALVADLTRLEASLGGGTASTALLLVSRRTLRSMNSWLHNSARMVSGKPRCTLEMHPDDASRRGVAQGHRAVVRSRVGEVEVLVEVTDRMMPGVVSLPFGWGHDRPDTRLSVARAHAAASFNDLSDERSFDHVDGTSVVDGIPVEVEPV